MQVGCQTDFVQRMLYFSKRELDFAMGLVGSNRMALPMPDKLAWTGAGLHEAPAIRQISIELEQNEEALQWFYDHVVAVMDYQAIHTHRCRLDDVVIDITLPVTQLRSMSQRGEIHAIFFQQLFARWDELRSVTPDSRGRKGPKKQGFVGFWTCVFRKTLWEWTIRVGAGRPLTHMNNGRLQFCRLSQCEPSSFDHRMGIKGYEAHLPPTGLGAETLEEHMAETAAGRDQLEREFAAPTLEEIIDLTDDDQS